MNLTTINKILFFGKSRAFKKEEFYSQLQHHSIEVTQEFSEDIDLLIDGRMMTPYEQNLSDKLYETKQMKALSIDVLERELASHIDANTLLMSLKLSHDKERLKAFIQNSMIDNALFFKLVKMYNWSKEDFFENDDNRDVSAAFISRFYENIERNHNVQYATTGFIHLVAQTQSEELLNAIYNLEPMALHPKIKMAIAMSPYINESMQNKMLQSANTNILEALSLNKKLSLSIIQELKKEERFAKNIAESRELNEELYGLLYEHKSSLAKNTTLNETQQRELLAFNEREISLALAQNENIRVSLIQELLAFKEEEIDKEIYKNSTTPSELLQEAYKEGLYFESLAQNEATPIEILYQLQLDSRYERYVKTNTGFGKHIQSENIGWLV